jgi:hypothetical protein
MSSLGASPAGDRLYRSSDGGTSWTDVLSTASPIVDLAVEQSGKVLVATLASGSFESTDHGASFSAMTGAPQLACVGQRSDGTVFGCGANWEPDFKAVARSSDGTSWNKVFRFVELAGPLDCPAGSAEHDVCGGQWPALQQQFGANGPIADVTPPPRRSGCCDAGASADQLGALATLAALCGTVLRRRRRRP